MRWRVGTGLAVGSLLAALTLGAPGATADDPAFITLGIGAYDWHQKDDQAVDFRLEYRHDQKIWVFKPFAGFEGTSDGAVYGLGGFMVDIFFGRRVVVTPSIAAGLYFEGDGKDLGSAIEFRSQVELAYRFNDRSRLGLAVSHISNAGIGDDNPGTEIVTLYYSIPLDKVFPATP